MDSFWKYRNPTVGLWHVQLELMEPSASCAACTVMFKSRHVWVHVVPHTRCVSILVCLCSCVVGLVITALHTYSYDTCAYAHHNSIICHHKGTHMYDIYLRTYIHMHIMTQSSDTTRVHTHIYDICKHIFQMRITTQPSVTTRAHTHTPHKTAAHSRWEGRYTHIYFHTPHINSYAYYGSATTHTHTHTTYTRTHWRCGVRWTHLFETILLGVFGAALYKAARGVARRHLRAVSHATHLEMASRVTCRDMWWVLRHVKMEWK